MLNLSYNNLVELTNVGKVPMITTSDLAPTPPVTSVEPVQEVNLSVETDRPVQDDSEKKSISAPIQSIVAPQVMKPMGSWGVNQYTSTQPLQENVDFITEIMDAGKLDKLVNSIKNLERAASIKGLERFRAPMDQLISQARKELANNTFFEGKAVKQLILFYNVLERIKDLWPNIKQLFSDKTFDEKDASELKGLLLKTAKDPFFKGLAQKMLTNHYPGLEPERIANELTDAARQEGGVVAVTEFFDSLQKNVQNTGKTGEPLGTSSATQSAPGTAPETTTQAAPVTQTTNVQTPVTTKPKGSGIFGTDNKEFPSTLDNNILMNDAEAQVAFMKATKTTPDKINDIAKKLADAGLIITKK
jgi:hypothetical protein